MRAVGTLWGEACHKLTGLQGTSTKGCICKTIHSLMSALHVDKKRKSTLGYILYGSATH